MSMENHLNSKITQVKPSPIREFDQLISQVPGIIKLTLGEPDFATPDVAKQGAIDAIKNNLTTYSPTPGTPAILKEIAHFLKRQYYLDYDPKTQIAATVGATEALAAAFMTLLNEGDKVIVPNPMFSLYDTIIRLQGGVPVHIDTSSNDFILSPEMIEEALNNHPGEIKAILLNYPTNPTGVTWTLDEAQKIANVCKKHQLFVVSDEVYSAFVYDGEHVSIASLLPEQTLLVNAVSKSHAMTGWRLGYIAGPESIMSYLMTAHQSMVTTASSISLAAATEALRQGDESIIEMKAAFKERRDFFYHALTDLGFSIAQPNGAFYIFAKIPKDLEQDSFKFALDLAQQAKVAGVPGTAFGVGCDQYIRFSYAANLDDLKLAAQRITEYIQNLRSQNNN